MKINSSKMKQTALVSALMLEFSLGAQAASINVDGATCNLNDAVTAANMNMPVGGCDSGDGDDVIELSSELNLEISDTLSITSNITVNGNGSTVSGPDTNSFQLVSIGNGFVTINDATFQKGSDDSIGGISVFGTGNLTLNRSVVKDIVGGGVSLQGWGGSLNQVTIENTGNSSGNLFGAALSVVGTTAGVSNSTIVNNNNQSKNSGGAIWTSDYTSSMALFMSNTTISGNNSANRGGGLSHSDYGNNTFIAIYNSTFINNSSDDVGGGLSLEAAGNVFISQTLVSGNTANGLGSQIHVTTATPSLNDYNLFGSYGDSGLEGVMPGASDIVPMGTTFGDIIDINLSDNGGLTKTHALLPNSEAIDVIPSASCGRMTDQTGKSRPIDGDGDGTADCDVGAFEYTDVIFEDGFD